jgi:hypothetical protein
MVDSQGGEGEQADRRQGPCAMIVTMAHDEDLADRIPELIASEALLAEPGARPLEMRGRGMKGRLRVDAESVSTKRALEPWAMQSVAFARALPGEEKQ